MAYFGLASANVVRGTGEDSGIKQTPAIKIDLKPEEYLHGGGGQ